MVPFIVLSEAELDMTKVAYLPRRLAESGATSSEEALVH
jgi:hypothetical protein